MGLALVLLSFVVQVWENVFGKSYKLERNEVYGVLVEALGCWA